MARPADRSPTRDGSAGEPSDPARPFLIVGVGASAGGLEAFTELLAALPVGIGMAFVLVQHLDPDHESQLPQILARTTSLPVGEIANDEPVRPDRVYVIPRDTGLTLVSGRLKLAPRERARAPHRPIDTFFESLAQDQGERSVGVVLSGTATDGTLGLEAIKAEGGITFAQDDSARQDSMPRSAVAAGCVDLVLSPAGIAHELARIAKHPWVAGRALVPTPAADGPAFDDRSALRGDSAGYELILRLLRSHSGVDFSRYKPTTIRRRINRRLVLNKQDTLGDYAGFLRGNADELATLYADVLLGVTSFFRNPETFDALRRAVIPRLLELRGDDPLRCWVPGCSTGQEAYSLAMAFMEATEQATRPRRLQIFATDLNEASIESARQGLYAKRLADDLTPERLRRFFVEEEGGYRVAKPLRELVIFARHNVLADPPLSRMDLISCRNLLIYLEPHAQEQAIAAFHYALKPGGFLLLGAAESLGGLTDAFETVDRKHKIYQKMPAPAPTLLQMSRGEDERPPHRPVPMQKVGTPGRPEGVSGELRARHEADRVTVDRFGPPGVLVSSALHALQFRGSTGAFLEPAPGKATLDVLKLARADLRRPLRSAIDQAKKEGTVARRDARVERNGKPRTVTVEVVPLNHLSERYFLILFEEGDLTAAPNPKLASTTAAMGRAARRVAELETELTELRGYLQSMEEQHEAANEAVRSAHEQVQSSNEQLQSVNEELETSKEELESANEELTTVNHEMANRNLELNRLNNDLVNVQASTKLCVVLFGRDLTLRSFSPQAERQFDLLLADVGRPIGHLRHDLHVEEKGSAASTRRPLELQRIVSEVITEVREQEHEVLDKAGRWRSLRVRPYLTLDNKVEGAVVVLMDIDTLKRSEQSIRAARDYAENIVETVRGPLLVLDAGLRVESVNRAFHRTFRVAPAETIGRPIFDLGNGQWDVPPLRDLLAGVAGQGTTIEELEVEHDLESIGRRTMRLSARRMRDSSGASGRILVSMEDVTDRKHAELATSRLASIVESSDDAIVSKTLDGTITSWNRGAERLFGYSAAEAVGQNIMLVIPNERHSEELEVLARLRRGESVEHFETERRAKDGHRITVSLTVSPIRDASGQVIGASKVARDVTAQRRAETMVRESEARFRTLVAQVKDYAIFRTDVQGRATTWNEGVEQVLGFDEMEFLGADITQRLFTVEDIDSGVPQRELHEAATVGTATIDRWMRRNNGERFAATGVITSLKSESGELLGFTKVMRDETQRVRAEEAQRLLEEESRRYTSELSKGSDRTNEFLAMLGHELRNPLSALSHGLEVLDTLADEDTQRRELAAMMGRQTKRIGVLLDQLLDLARVTAGKVELSMNRVDVADVVRAAAETARPLVERQRHELTLTLPPERSAFVMGDPVWLTQVVDNLLTNAAKYTDEGGQVHVSLDSPAEDKVRIAVRDNGSGISADLLPRIFEAFTQGPRTLERSKGGLGLGLSLVSQLVKMHGGEVTASSAGPGHGSEFVVTLPRIIERRSRDRDGAESPEPTRSRRILVVDDEEDTRETFAELLEQDGQTTLAVEDGPAALRAVGTFDPEVVLLDLGLPGMDGYEVARRLREDYGDRKLLLIAVTGYQRDDARLKQAGFNDHLIKPASFAKLSALLRASDRREA